MNQLMNYFLSNSYFISNSYLLFCLIFQFSSLLFSYISSPGIKLFDPIATQYFGKMTYLTYQGNYLILGYFFIAFYNSLFQNNFLTYLISYIYPLVFSLSFFITIGFYILDYRNPTQVKKRSSLVNIFPYLYITTHTDHFFSFPLVVFFGCYYPIEYIHNNNLVIFYTIGYIALISYNKYLTTAWPYPIICEIETKFGFIGRNLFFIFLICFNNFLSKNFKLLI